MHNLGRQIKVEVVSPSGQKTPVIYIDNWDFNWQGFYTLANPMSIASGSTVLVTSVFDNSEVNPKNPNNAIAPVGCGERTTDEMRIAFIRVIFDNQAILGVPFIVRDK